MLFANDRGPSQTLDDVLADVAMVSPGFVYAEPGSRTGTTVILHGTRYGEAVTVKALTSSSPRWREQFAREIEVYRLFAASRPPVRVPRLVEADDRRMILVMERVVGLPVGTKRHPDTYPGREVLASILTELRLLSAWRPAVPVGWRVNYMARLERAARQGLLRPDEYEGVRRLLVSALRAAGDDGWEFGHGDPELTNVLVATDGLVFVDWGAAGLFLPGFDLALLWVILGDLAGPRRVVDDLVHEAGSSVADPFLVNVALLLAHEVRAHRTMRPSPERDARLCRLATDWAEIRRRLVTTS